MWHVNIKAPKRSFRLSKRHFDHSLKFILYGIPTIQELRVRERVLRTRNVPQFAARTEWDGVGFERGSFPSVFKEGWLRLNKKIPFLSGADGVVRNKVA